MRASAVAWIALGRSVAVGAALTVASVACDKPLFSEEDADLPTDLPPLAPAPTAPPSAASHASNGAASSPSAVALAEAGAPGGLEAGAHGRPAAVAAGSAKAHERDAGEGGAPGVCGDPPNAPCPLQAWMKAHASPDVMSGDLDAIAEDFDTIATFAPGSPDAGTLGFDNWVSIAKDGADAARAASVVGIRGACRGCHQQYKDRYRAALRPRPLP